MTRRLLATPALACLLVACQATGSVTVKPSTAPASRAPATAATSAAPAPPKPTAAAPGAVRLAKPTLLQAPPGATVKLAGSLQLDPIALQRLGAVRLNGGLVVANNGATLVANNGGGIISDNGSGLVANNGGGLVSDSGGSAVALAAGNLVAAAGAGFEGLSARGAAGAIAVAGAAGLAPPKAYALAQAAPPTGSGAEPAAGLLISVVSLATGRFVPLGQDAEGRPAYTIYTNAAGGFEAWLPADVGRNVLIAAAVPGKPNQVVKAGVLATAADTAARVDDDTAALTGFVRRSLAGRLAALMASPSPDELENSLLRASQLGGNVAAQEIMRGTVRKIHALAVKRGIPTTADPALREARAQVAAQAATDAAFAGVDLSTFVIDPNFAPDWRKPTHRPPGVPEEGANLLATLTTCFKELRTRTQAKMANPAGGYTPLPPDFTVRVAIGDNPSPWYMPQAGDGDWFEEVLAKYPPQAVALETPAAVLDHVLDVYMAKNRPFTFGPAVAAYALLDPATYPQGPSIFFYQQDQGLALDALAKLNARLPGGIVIRPEDPQFEENRHAAAFPYASAVNIAGTTILMHVAFSMLDDAAPVSLAIAAAIADTPLPDQP